MSMPMQTGFVDNTNNKQVNVKLEWIISEEMDNSNFKDVEATESNVYFYGFAIKNKITGSGGIFTRDTRVFLRGSTNSVSVLDGSLTNETRIRISKNRPKWIFLKKLYDLQGNKITRSDPSVLIYPLYFGKVDSGNNVYNRWQKEKNKENGNIIKLRKIIKYYKNMIEAVRELFTDYKGELREIFHKYSKTHVDFENERILIPDYLRPSLSHPKYDQLDPEAILADSYLKSLITKIYPIKYFEVSEPKSRDLKYNKEFRDIGQYLTWLFGYTYVSAETQICPVFARGTYYELEHGIDKKNLDSKLHDAVETFLIAKYQPILNKDKKGKKYRDRVRGSKKNQFRTPYGNSKVNLLFKISSTFFKFPFSTKEVATVAYQLIAPENGSEKKGLDTLELDKREWEKPAMMHNLDTPKYRKDRSYQKSLNENLRL